MTWREKVLVHILLLVARIFADDPVIAQEVKNLSNHVSVHAPKADADAPLGRLQGLGT